MTAITGNTYPVKDQIKSLGGKWNADQKVWMVPDDKAEQARALVANAPKSNFTNFRPTKCRECGVAGSRYNPIYRSGYCKDCYVSDREEREMGY